VAVVDEEMLEMLVGLVGLGEQEPQLRRKLLIV